MNLEDCINYLLTNAQHTVFQLMKKELEPFDLTPIQYGVLKCIWQKKYHNPKDIASFLNIETSTISGILERMENKGLIQREIDESDRRFIRIELTEKSKGLEESVNQVVEEVNRKVLFNFSETSISSLKELLRQISTV